MNYILDVRRGLAEPPWIVVISLNYAYIGDLYVCVCVCTFNYATGADSGQISEETWNFLHSIYGGGPLVTVRPSISHQEAESSQSEEKIEVETRSV